MTLEAQLRLMHLVYISGFSSQGSILLACNKQTIETVSVQITSVWKIRYDNDSITN